VTVAGMRVIVHRGATIPTAEYSSLRVDYTVEAEVPSGKNASDFVSELETTLDASISKQRQAYDRNDVLIVPSDLEKLPWKKYERGPGEWIRAETAGAEGLLAKLQASNGLWQNSNYVYKLSKSKSSGRLFIKRFRSNQTPVNIAKPVREGDS